LLNNLNVLGRSGSLDFELQTPGVSSDRRLNGIPPRFLLGSTLREDLMHKRIHGPLGHVTTIPVWLYSGFGVADTGLKSQS
jgi:hypothetical protein